MLRLRRDHRDRLDRRRAGADHADAHAGEVHAFMRPVAGVVGLALEARQSLEVRRARVRQRAGRHDDVLRGVALAVVGGHRPAIGALVEHGRGDAGVELDVGAQVEAVGDVVGVFQDLRLGGEALGPLPLLLQLVRERVRILHALDVAARAGIAVPVPGAADAGALLEHAHRKAEARAGDAAGTCRQNPRRRRSRRSFSPRSQRRVGVGSSNASPRFLMAGRCRPSSCLSRVFYSGAKAQVTISARPSPIPRGARPRTAGTGLRISPSGIFAVARPWFSVEATKKRQGKRP